MITLAFDSTARVASCAVMRDGVALGSYSIDNGLTQSELLLPMAEDMLKSLKLDFSDIGLLACSVGPGSFTGVRIGVALIKGLAFGRNIPCAAVSTLRALAENLVPMTGIIVPVMDARRGQVYTALFECDGNRLTRLTPDMAISIKELSELLKQYTHTPIYLVGDGYNVAAAGLRELGTELKETPMLLRLQNAVSVARAAEEIYREGKTVSDSELAPCYLRLPQAERERLEALKKKD